ncbi:BC85_0335 family putative methyltransferase [Mycoplasmopsis gallinarum]|uniref:BC85_0335 family putative methyltransferase n=1 Tax=Mycoplasmopsis gallinarum TaxID=29557 RepID=UPI00068598BE|nr:hypothetical protein [Mycoplasmopsis gallinarum]
MSNEIIKWILIASVILVCLVAVSIYGLMFYKTKKLRQKLVDEEVQKANEKILQIRGESLGHLPHELLKYLPNSIDEMDLENLINSTYLNDAKETLIIGNNNAFEYASLNYLGFGNFDLVTDTFNAKEWNLAVLEFPQYFNKKTNLLTEVSKTYDLIFVINSSNTNQEIFNNYFDFLKEKGMMIILQNNSQNDLKEFKKELKKLNLIYEISYVKGKFLYIVKKQKNKNHEL